MPEPTNTYVLPDDPLEGERLNIQHRLLREGVGNHLAPIRQPRAILDVAGGTGVWGRELAREFPEAQVETFDRDLLNLRQAAKRVRAWPGNFHFWGQENAEAKTGPDALAPWAVYDDGRFDYVHARYINPFIPLTSWPHILSEMLRVARPGGWVELLEGPLATCEAPGYREIEEAIVRLAHARLGYYNAGPHLAGWMRKAGITQVVEKRKILGTGASRHLQASIAKDLFEGFRSIGPVLIQFGFISKARHDARMRGLLEAILEAGIVLPVWVVYGQKPDAIISR